MKPVQENHSNGGVQRNIGLITASAIVVANMIGTGIFTTSGIMAAHLPGPLWVLGCWLLGGCIALAGALCYAELATRMPEEGGEYVYLNRLYHPALGFLTGWTSFWVGFSAPIAASALAFSAYLFAGLGPSLPALTPASLVLVKKATAILLIGVFTLLHYFGHRLGAGVQNVLTAIKVGLILVLVGLGFALAPGNWQALVLITEKPASGFAFGTAMMLVMFSYSGWNASAYIAGEIKNPGKNLPRSLTYGTLIVMVIYLAVNLFIFYTVPFGALNGVITVVEKAAVFAFGNWMGTGISLVIALALLSSLSAYIIIGPRVYYAMARDRLFFPFAGRVSRFGVPGSAIIIQGVVAILMVLLGTFEQLLIYVGFALAIFPWLAIIGIFIARRRQVGIASVVKVWGYPLTPIFYLVTSLILLIVAFINRPLESGAALGTVVLGGGVYWIWKKIERQAGSGGV